MQDVITWRRKEGKRQSKRPDNPNYIHANPQKFGSGLKKKKIQLNATLKGYCTVDKEEIHETI